MVTLTSFETSIDRRLESKAEIELPRLIDVKLNAIDNIATDCQKLLLQETCSLIVDEITYDIAGKRVEDNLKAAGIDVHVLTINGATMTSVEKACELYKEVNAKFSVAVGGGTVIDVAKYSSFKENIPFVSIPTVASHDGISSARASIKTSDRSFTYEARPPTLVIGDIETMSKAPKRFAISGACDLLSNKTAVLDWQLAHRITGEHVSEYASALANLTADSMIESRKEIAADAIKRTYTVFKGLISSSMAMCIAASSRPASGAEHLISHRLDKLMEKPAMHGEQCGLMAVFTMYLHGGDWKELKDTLVKLGAPSTAEELGVNDDILIEAITTAQEKRPERYTILSSGVTTTATKLGLEITGII